MRRTLLALAALAAAAATAHPAAAAPTCTPTAYAGVCVEYVCNDLCGPSVHVDPYCDIPGPVIAACEAVDHLYYETR